MAIVYSRRRPRGLTFQRPPAPAFLPPGSLAHAVAALGDIGDGTGIEFIDSNLTAIKQQVAEASLAAKITAVCSIAGALASVLLIIRTGGPWRR
jgi:hypothetical protein